MILTQNRAQSRQRILAERPRLGDLPKLSKVAGEIRGNGERIVVVARKTCVEARKGSLVELAGSGGVSGHAPQQCEVAGAAVSIRMIRTVKPGVAGHRPFSQLERLVG